MVIFLLFFASQKYCDVSILKKKLVSACSGKLCSTVSVSQQKLSNWSVLEVGAGDGQASTETFLCLCCHLPPSETWPVLPTAWCRESCELAGAFSTRITPRGYCHEDLAPFTWVLPLSRHASCCRTASSLRRAQVLQKSNCRLCSRGLVCTVPLAQWVGK